MAYYKEYQLGWAQCWHSTINSIFERKKINCMMEFGLGIGTEYLLDNVDHLISIELSVSGLNKEWTQKIKQLCSNRENWSCYYEEMPNSIVNSNILVQKVLHPLEDSSYKVDLESIVKKYMNKYNKIDLLFVDPGIHHRGDIVLMGMEFSIPIIIAHDTNYQKIYGYNLVDHPMYEICYKTNTQNGTTVWCHKDHKLN